MSKPVSVFDVAQYILERQGMMTTWKLQKLVYYCQAWSLVWDEQKLFSERIEAWSNGPVVPKLYKAHRGQFHVRSLASRGDSSELSRAQKDTVRAVLRAYGDKPSQWLSDLTHREMPWQLARQRGHLAPGERGGTQIRLRDMQEYYESLG